MTSNGYIWLSASGRSRNVKNIDVICYQAIDKINKYKVVTSISCAVAFNMLKFIEFVVGHKVAKLHVILGRHAGRDAIAE